MKVGVLARAEDRGLGIMLWEWCRHMHPDRVLIVDMGPLARGFAMHLDRYPDASPLARFDGREFTDPDRVRDWLTGLDVVYVAETWYDERFPDWCADLGVRVVCHVMPEFFRWHRRFLPAVTWWTPTVWRLGALPGGTRVVPVPVPLDRWPQPQPLHEARASFVHVAGRRAAGDRNGTGLVLAAAGRCTAAMRVTVVTQDPRLPDSRHAPQVDVERITGGIDPYWRLPFGHDVLVMPRRYGGLCLPAHEAAGAGLGLVMTDTRANAGTWPIEPIPVSSRSAINTPAGSVETTNADARALAGIMDRLARDHEMRHARQRAARAWAESHSWATMRPTIVAELGRACG